MGCFLVATDARVSFYHQESEGESDTAKILAALERLEDQQHTLYAQCNSVSFPQTLSVSLARFVSRARSLVSLARAFSVSVCLCLSVCLSRARALSVCLSLSVLLFLD